MVKRDGRCQWIGLREALSKFVETTRTQSSEHIKPLHWYVACRLVLEGGFLPTDITPRPPFRVESHPRQPPKLHFDEQLAGAGEQTVLGGLKTKDVDVVVAKEKIGPCIALSLKGTQNAFRNLTNRMEEAVGDCTNLHISYPALVYGFVHVPRATSEGPGIKPEDVAITPSGHVVASITRYHDVLLRLTGRNDLRNESSKYEAVTLALVDPTTMNCGELLATFPPPESDLGFGRFFERLYRAYDMRFVYAAPRLSKTTERLEWHSDSPVVRDRRRPNEYEVRITQSLS